MPYHHFGLVAVGRSHDMVRVARLVFPESTVLLLLRIVMFRWLCRGMRLNTGSGSGLLIGTGVSEAAMVVAPFAAVNFLAFAGGIMSGFASVEVIALRSLSFSVVVGSWRVLLAGFLFEKLRVRGRRRVEILPVPDGGSLRRRARVSGVLVSSWIKRPGTSEIRALADRRGRGRGLGENVGKPRLRMRRLAAAGVRVRRRRRRRGRSTVVGGAEKNRGGVFRDGEGLAGGKGGEGGAGETKGAAVVRVSGGEKVASVDGVFHQTAALLAATDGVLTVELGGCASHFQRTRLLFPHHHSSLSKDRLLCFF